MSYEPHRLLAVDPGKKGAGVAYFVGGVLKRCAFVVGDGPFEVALAVSLWNSVPVSDLVVEGQQIYGRFTATDPNDLLPLAQVVGGVFARIRHHNRHNPLPRQWKGSVAKAVFTERLRADLTDHEAALLSALRLPKRTEHNVLDAIGLGKWCLAHV